MGVSGVSWKAVTAIRYEWTRAPPPSYMYLPDLPHDLNLEPRNATAANLTTITIIIHNHDNHQFHIRQHASDVYKSGQSTKGKGPVRKRSLNSSIQGLKQSNPSIN